MKIKQVLVILVVLLILAGCGGTGEARQWEVTCVDPDYHGIVEHLDVSHTGRQYEFDEIETGDQYIVPVDSCVVRTIK